MTSGLKIPPRSSIDAVAQLVFAALDQQGLHIAGQDLHRPWGGFFNIDEGQVEEFIDHYFAGERGRISDGRLSPRLLLISPHQRLSWQYHQRRQELWKVVIGPVGTYLSPTNDQPSQPKVARVNQVIPVGRTTRHRLEGLNNWAIVAEIWSHTNPAHPSDEADFIRLADDFGRNSPTSSKL